MKYLRLLTLIFVLSFFGCKQSNQTTAAATENQTKNLKATEESKDKEEIQNLIRRTLNWSNSKKSVDLLPVVTDSSDSIYIGFDLNKHRANLIKLRETNFFTADFIKNYNQIILTLDRKLRNKEIDEWRVGDLPTFAFANDVNPWSLCQDVPYDEPNPWDLVEVKIISLSSKNGELYWKWGKPELNDAADWKEFSYRFKVAKENGRWKIDYLQGFDFKESIRE